MDFLTRNTGVAVLATLALAAVLTAGCKQQAPAVPTDQQIATAIQSKLAAEPALAGQDLHVAVQSGVATLTGTAANEASRALAGTESGSISGVKTVVNNLTVQTASAAPPQSAPAPVTATPVVPADKKSQRKERKQEEHRAATAPAVAQPTPVAVQAVAPQPPPPAPPKPVLKTVTLEAGTVVPVRITETLDTKTAQANDVFHGSLAGDLMVGGVVAVPHGAPIMGRVVEAQEAAHFKGSALLSLELTEVRARGQRLTIATESYTQAGAGRGKNTAAKTGGGAAFGAIVGALAGGGKGAAIGGLAGAGAGAGINAATRGKQVVIPSETLISFRLQSPLTLTVTIPPARANDNDQEPTLQRR